MLDHYKAFGASDIEILRTFTWPYFPMWTIEGKRPNINDISSRREGVAKLEYSDNSSRLDEEWFPSMIRLENFQTTC